MNAAPAATSDPQHLRALARANEIRLARAELKRAVSQGRAAAADVILDCPWEAHSMTVADVLMSQRRWGLTRCRKVLFALQLSELKTVGALTDRQRHALAARLRAGTPAEPALALA
jgi:hypothetical protein